MTDEDKTEDQAPAEEQEPQAKLNKGDILQVIANALKLGTITSEQAAGMRAEIGVFGSDFTKKQETGKERKKKRKAQSKARRITKNKGYKGQQPPSGRTGRGASRGG